MSAEEQWTPFTQKYKVHEESYEYVRMSQAMGARPYSELTVEEAREQSNTRGTVMAGSFDFKGEEYEVTVPSPYSPSGIPVTVYKPTNCSKDPLIMIYFHGGGLVIGSRQAYATTLQILATDAKIVMLNVEYRLLPNPESPLAPFDDAEVVTKWVLENKEKVGGSVNSKVGVGGDSAGGQISISVTNEMRGLAFQVLVYPMSDTSMANDTFREFKQVPGLNEGAIDFFFKNSLRQVPDFLTNPRINGMVRTNTELSPPALILLAELDPLRGCGLDYAEKLKKAGVPVEVQIVEGVPHAFFTLRNAFKTKCPEAYALIVKYLSQFQ